MVRLKDDLRKLQEKTRLLFQFHYGTIKRQAAEEDYKQQVHFNSTMVRLKGRSWIQSLHESRISIPLWYD